MIDSTAHEQYNARLAERFMTAFKGIEGLLQDEARDSIPRRTFSSLLASSRNPTVREHRALLREFADLRNVIVHEWHPSGHPIATPLQATIEKIEAVLGQLRRPPTVDELVRGQEIIATVGSESLKLALQRLAPKDLSQAPAFDAEDRYLGLFTTNSVARWLASHIDENGEVLAESTTVADVLTFNESHEVAKHISRRKPIASALATLRDAVNSARGPIALIVTESGRPEERPLGILVIADILRMQEKLALFRH